MNHHYVYAILTCAATPSNNWIDRSRASEFLILPSVSRARPGHPRRSVAIREGQNVNEGKRTKGYRDLLRIVG